MLMKGGKIGLGPRYKIHFKSHVLIAAVVRCVLNTVYI